MSKENNFQPLCKVWTDLITEKINYHKDRIKELKDDLKTFGCPKKESEIKNE
jgi:hypothetical protein